MSIEILIVDDEEDVLELIAKILNLPDYTILKATSAINAIDIVRQNSQQFLAYLIST
jgi:CheY-like chemotaxis protein